jgi:hypothetical protein
MQFRHAPVIQVLAAAHGVGKVNAPVISIVHIPHRSRHATFRHYGVRLTEKRFRNDRNLHTRSRSFDGGAQTGATCADDQNIVLMRDVLGH